MNTNRLTASLLSFLIIFGGVAARAQQPAEGGGPAQGAAWQVLQYEVAVDAAEAAAAGKERALKARASVRARNVGTAAARTFTARLSPRAAVESASVAGSPVRFTSRTEARTELQIVPLSLPSEVPPGAEVQVTYQYRLPVAENSGLAALSPEGLQFLPLSFWYPTPNSPVAPRGADYAPARLTVTGLTAGEQVVSAGKTTGAAAFDQPLNSQPFFLTGRWETVEGAGDARGVSALLHAGPTAEERKQAEALVQYAAAARAFYASLLGPAPDAPVRLVGVRRGGGFEMAGTLLLDHAVFRRPKLDSLTAMQVADAVARLWVGGSAAVGGEGAGAVREGLPRFLATLFIEKQFGKAVADAERLRLAQLYAPVARRDPPLGQLTPAFNTYFNSAPNKGALVWNLVMNAVGREAFLGLLRSQLAPGASVSLASLRTRLSEAGGPSMTTLLAALFDQPTDTDLLIGLPQPRPGGWASALRNLGSFDVDVTVVGVTEAGERLTVRSRVPSKDFGEALFKTAARLVSVEIDPDKLYPQLDYSNDAAPRAPAAEEALEQARVQLQQQPARAQELARGVLARSPGRHEARVVLGRALVEQNKLDEAEREFRAALEAPLPTPSTLAWAQVGLGEVALRRGRAAEAAKLFDAAVKTDAEYASSLAARAARLKAEAAAGAAPAVDEQIKTAAASLDAALRGGRGAEIEAMLIPGELASFAKGVVTTQPEVWQTRVLRTEALDPNRVAADVTLTVRAQGRDQTGPAVLVFARTPGGWKLSEVPIFEVR